MYTPKRLQVKCLRDLTMKTFNIDVLSSWGDRLSKQQRLPRLRVMKQAANQGRIGVFWVLISLPEIKCKSSRRI